MKNIREIREIIAIMEIPSNPKDNSMKNLYSIFLFEK